MKRFLITPLLMLSMIGVASAKAGDGNALLKACQASIEQMENNNIDPDYFVGYCHGLVHGVLDSVDDSSNQPLLRACVPDGVTGGQAVRIVTRYLQTHPEQLHLRDTHLVYSAIQDAYPCKS